MQPSPYLQSALDESVTADQPQAPNLQPSSFLRNAYEGEGDAHLGTVSQAEHNIGSQEYDGMCEAFAEQMAGLPKMGRSAAEAWDNQRGKAVSGLKGIRPGDLIYYAPDASNNYDGHVAVAAGNGKQVGATYGGVEASDINDWTEQTGQSILGYIPQ